MEDKKFDNYIHDALGDFKEEYDPASWQSLSTKLDKLDSSSTDEEFDGEVKNTIEDYSESYNPHTWPILLKKMEENEYYRARLYGTKMAEAVLLVLLLITIGRMVPGPDRSQDATPVQYAQQTEPQTQASQPQDVIARMQAVSIHDLEQMEPDNIQIALPAISSGSVPEKLVALDKSQESTEADHRSMLAVPDPGSQGIESVPVLYPDPLNLNEDLALSGSTASVIINPNLVGLIAMSSINSIPQASALWLNKIRKHNPKNLYLSLFAGTDINLIETPFDRLLSNDGYWQARAGFGGGVSLLYGGKTVFLETGFSYSAKNYSPEKFVELLPFNNSNLYKGESLEDIRFNILSVPLNVLYKIDQKGKWQMYASAGSSLNLSVISSYRKEEQIISNHDPLPPKHLINSSRVAQLDKKDYQAGLFEGGEFKDNYFVTLNSGLGVERHLGSEWILFMQSSYQFNFFNTGLGPNQDRISTFSLSLGTRYKLK